MAQSPGMGVGDAPSRMLRSQGFPQFATRLEKDNEKCGIVLIKYFVVLSFITAATELAETDLYSEGIWIEPWL
jgi:hypothetical protein